MAALGLIDAEDIPSFKELSESGPRFKPVTLNFRLTDEQIEGVVDGGARHHWKRLAYLRPHLVRRRVIVREEHIPGNRHALRRRLDAVLFEKIGLGRLHDLDIV